MIFMNLGVTSEMGLALRLTGCRGVKAADVADDNGCGSSSFAAAAAVVVAEASSLTSSLGFRSSSLVMVLGSMPGLARNRVDECNEVLVDNRRLL